GAGNPGNVIGFDGYVFNPEIETYTVRFRWYDPELGRWLQRDVLEYPDGMNRYQQSLSNMTSYIDPMGLAPTYRTADDPPLSYPEVEAAAYDFLIRLAGKAIDKGWDAIQDWRHDAIRPTAGQAALLNELLDIAAECGSEETAELAEDIRKAIKDGEVMIGKDMPNKDGFVALGGKLYINGQYLDDAQREQDMNDMYDNRD